MNIHTYYGNIHALKGVSFEVDSGEIIALIGCKWRWQDNHAQNGLRLDGTS